MNSLFEIDSQNLMFPGDFLHPRNIIPHLVANVLIRLPLRT